MSECPPPPIWETLPLTRQRVVLLTLAQMALRRLRGAPIAEETADDGGSRGPAGQLDAGKDPT